jgi:membrane protein
MKVFTKHFRLALVRVYQANGLGISKGAAYSALLSLFPVLTTLAAVLAQFRARAVLTVLSSLLSEIVPPGTEDVVLTRFLTTGARPVGLLFVAGLLSLWAASGLMLSLMEGFDRAYLVKTDRSLIRKRLVAALLVFATALPAVGASAMILFGERTQPHSPDGCCWADVCCATRRRCRRWCSRRACFTTSARIAVTHSGGSSRGRCWRRYCG